MRRFYTIRKYDPDQTRDDHGRFAGGGGGSGSGKVDAARARTADAAAKLELAAQRSAAATERHAASKQAAEHAVSAAKQARTAAKRNPTAENVNAWHQATKAALRARNQADRHQAEATMHSARHEKAEIAHALAQANQHEVERAAAGRTALPRAIPIAETPSFSIGTGRVAGAEAEPPPKESTLDMLSRTRPRYVHDESAAAAHRAQASADRQAREERAARDRQHRLRFPLDHVPGVSAISLRARKQARRQRQIYTKKRRRRRIYTPPDHGAGALMAGY